MPTDANEKPRSRRKTLTIAFVVWAIAILTMVFGIRLRHRVNDARTWPTTKGHVLERTVEGPDFAKGTNFQPKVRYEYDVDGKHFVNDQYYSEAGQYGDLRRMRNIVRDTPDTVEVHYSTKDPAKSYLEIGSIALAWLAMGFSLFLGFVGLVFFAQ